MPMGEMPGKPKGAVWEPSYCLEDDANHYCTTHGVLGQIDPHPFRCVFCNGRFSAAEMHHDFGAAFRDCAADAGGLHFLGVCDWCARTPDFAGLSGDVVALRWYEE